jgi:hypothetical protein
VRIKNVFAAENKSFPARTVDCALCVTQSPLFRRGDCNSDEKSNLADAAATVSYLFPTGPAGTEFLPDCLDACDSNDDGRIDIADAIRILGWLFRSDPPPPAPGPDQAGLDPTEDKLSCTPLGCPGA